MIISHNLLAINASRQNNIVTDKKKKSLEKLSSGYRINRAADDAAGLAISEKMRRQIRGLTRASLNVQDGIGYVQTADGALNECHDMLQRMNELSIQAANGTYTDSDREHLDSEVQQLKSELDRIFTTTTFNDKLIWDPDSDEKKQIGTENKKTISFTSTYKSIDVTNNNVHILPKNGSIKILANITDGIKLNWTGNDGNTYETGYLDWGTVKSQNYSFKMSDLYDNDIFYDTSAASPTPYFDLNISINPTKYTKLTDIVAAVNNSSVSLSEGVGLSARFEDSAGVSVSSPMSVSASLNFDDAYRSHVSGAADAFDFDNASDSVIEIIPNSSGGNLHTCPAYTDVSAAQSDSTGFIFKFDFAGIGEVSAQMTQLSYSQSNYSIPEAEGSWWKWNTRSDGTKYQSTLSHTIIGNSLQNIMNALTGGYGDSTPGMLSEENGGCNPNGGSISLYFSMTDSSGKKVGSLSFSFSINPSDTEETILNKIKDSFNKTTVLDLYTSNNNINGNRVQIGPPRDHGHTTDVPVYLNSNYFYIQSGSEADQQIEMTYESLSVSYLGLDESNVRTADDAKQCISTIKAAMETVSMQRSDFGAFQNRLEHTLNNLNNVIENTQSAESVIRDTDMAKEIGALSTANILEQAGISMMAQANQVNDTVLKLLQ